VLKKPTLSARSVRHSFADGLRQHREAASARPPKDDAAALEIKLRAEASFFLMQKRKKDKRTK